MSAPQPNSASSPTQGPTWKTRPYEPRHATWPYSDADFARQDPRPDASFYDTPRFVTHIDDEAIASLRSYYDTVLPRKGRILDLCSSWVSHYPQDIEKAASAGAHGSSSEVDGGGIQLTGMGMNRAELAANPVLNHGRVVVDLNEQPDVARALREEVSTTSEKEKKYDACTLVVSIDYLTRPVEVLKSLRGVMREGGVVHLTISNRCFPTKAIARWLRISEEERLQMVGDYLHFAGWKGIEIVELSDGKPQGKAASQAQGGLLNSIFGVVGMGHSDPLWVVRGVNGAS
ncbi:Serine/threonine-protein kinase ppk30 [Apiospora arundinis]|uniref:Serine/threonine-protein kinase ppk30 n=1 Tax=Apiospora arundinis TaxID=335852 RepID=A0ABR2I403_9PEZI